MINMWIKEVDCDAGSTLDSEILVITPVSLATQCWCWARLAVGCPWD